MYIQSMYKQQPTSILTSLFTEDDLPSDPPTLLSTAKQKCRESHIKLKDIIVTLMSAQESQQQSTSYATQVSHNIIQAHFLLHMPKIVHS